MDKETAVLLSKIFLEMVIAPGFTAEALQLLTEKKNIRLIKLDVQADKVIENKYTSVSCGMLIQTKDQEKVTAFEREVLPGELIMIDHGGLISTRFAMREQRKMCAMEYVYLSRPAQGRLQLLRM